MKERPILFIAPMVQALLAGRKTQTRREIKLPRWTVAEDVIYMDEVEPVWPHALSAVSGCMAPVECPYGKPGDRLWVREAWTSGYQDGCWGTAFRADMTFVQGKRAHPKGPHFHAKELGDHVRWRPSIHMPRWASRITLEITEVRVQRLQEISGDDALSEGVSVTPFWTPKEVEGKPFEEKWWDDFYFHQNYPQIAFQRLWESINGEVSWQANPWVWAISFKVLTPRGAK